MVVQTIIIVYCAGKYIEQKSNLLLDSNVHGIDTYVVFFNIPFAHDIIIDVAIQAMDCNGHLCGNARRQLIFTVVSLICCSLYVV